MICLSLVVGEAINLDFKHNTLATQPGDCAVCVVFLAEMPSLGIKHIVFYTNLCHPSFLAE